MPSDPAGYVIKRPMAEEPGDYILFVTRPSSGPFGSGGVAIFAVSEVVVYSDHVEATTPDHRQITFSKDMPFLCIPRGLSYPVSTADMARLQIEERKEWESVMGPEEDTLAPVPVPSALVPEAPPTGQYL